MPHLITFKCQQLFSDTDTIFISALTNLESLKVHRNALSDQGIKTLCEMTKLEEIKLWNSSRITNAGMKNLNRLTALTQLNTNNCPGIDNEVLAHLSTLTNLQSLALNFCNNKQFELQPADIFKKLTHLHVEDAKLSALGFTFNTAFPNLRILNLNFCSINEPQLQSLMQSTQLVELYLRKAITSDLYKSVSFSNMRQLKKLQLSITDTPIVYDFDDFAKLTALTYLGLGSFYNKDSQISKLHSLTNLSSLHTAHIMCLTFAGLEQIARLPNLTYFKTSTELNKKHVKRLFKIGQSIDKICWDSTLTTRYSLQKTTINQL